jgi:hypothetical protein
VRRDRNHSHGFSDCLCSRGNPDSGETPSSNAKLDGERFFQAMNQSAGARSMHISVEDEFFTELTAGHDGPPIPEAKRAYFEARFRNRLFDFIVGKFVQEQRNGLTKAGLARRIGKSPEAINRWLGAPSNLTADTISTLLLGISAEEPEMSSRSVFEPAQPLKFVVEVESSSKAVRPNPQPRRNVREVTFRVMAA